MTKKMRGCQNKFSKKRIWLLELRQYRENWINKSVKYKSVTDVRKIGKKYGKKIELEETTKRSLSKENAKTLYQKERNEEDVRIDF